MKTFLSLTAAFALAFSANMACADVDYDDLLEECQEAAEHAFELKQVAQSLPMGFPNRSEFVSRSSQMHELLYFASAYLQGVVNGNNPEYTPNQIITVIANIQDFRSDVQWVESEARQIERNNDGQFEDLAETMRRHCDEIDDSLRGMKNELD